MSFIRPGTEPKWVDDADTDGLYVYSDGERLQYMPRSEKEFVEVVMRMLEQSRELDEEQLAAVNRAFGVRFGWVEVDRDYDRNITKSDAYHDMTTAMAWMQDRAGCDDEYETAKEIWEKLDRCSDMPADDNTVEENL